MMGLALIIFGVVYGLMAFVVCTVVGALALIHDAIAIVIGSKARAFGRLFRRNPN